MNGTLLIDLDETLLKNRTDSFVPGYLQAWSEFIAPYFEPERFIAAMLSGTRAMAKNPRLDCSLRQVFEEVFYPAAGTTRTDFQPLEEAFYRDVFPTLQNLTQPKPGAVEFVEKSLQAGFQIAIATNPFFPLTAIEQRLEWAGLPVDRYHFSLVPDIAAFHFGKPHPAFFAELLAYLGWPPGPLVMIGDEPDLDIRPADQLGLNTFWMAKDGLEAPTALRHAHASGGFSELANWLDNLPDASADFETPSPEALLAILQSTPAALDTLASRMDKVQWNQQDQADEWCPAEIVCHLRDVDLEVNLPRFSKILQEENPFLAGMDTDRWNEERQYHLQDGPGALQSFIATRLTLLKLLSSIDTEGWQRVARHSFFGRTDLLELVRIIAEHDQLHIRQFLQSSQT